MRDDVNAVEVPDLRADVLALLRQIPLGRVTTYGDVARALGDERARAARWLGEFLQDHPHTDGCPCHRVVRAEGNLGRHVSGDPGRKADLLKREGIAVSDTGQVDVSSRFVEFQSSRPLERLREFQQHLGRRMRLIPLGITPRTFAGIDVAYRHDGLACGAYVELDARSLETIREVAIALPVAFPYVPGYLAFREMPVMLEVCRLAAEDGPLADVLFVDGNGLLHPWRAGIAVCVGVMLDHPTLGIGKSLLCGSVDGERLAAGEAAPVVDQGETVGLGLKASLRSRPVYVSPGHRMTLAEAATLVTAATTTHRLPEPIHRADRLSKQIKGKTA